MTHVLTTLATSAGAITVWELAKRWSQKRRTVSTRSPRDGEYADPQPIAVDIGGDEA